MCIYVVWHASPIFTSRLHGLVCIDVRLLVPFLGPRSMLHQCAFMLFGMLHQCLLCIYVVWYDSPMLFAVHTNIWYCLTSLANVYVQLSVPFLGPFSICFPNVTCCSCCFTCFPNVTCCCFNLWMHPDRWFRGCTQFEENASKEKGQLSPSPGRGPYAPDGVIGLTTEAMTEVYRVAFGQRA